VDLWLSRYSFGPSSRNLHISTVKALFAMALRDNVICHSPSDHLCYFKREKPIRKTPTFDEFKAIVADIRSQQFNPNSEESADFVEFIGLAGLGQAEASALRLGDIDWDEKQSQRSATRQKQDLRFHFIHRYGSFSCADVHI
jgi:site-specific recombinase XerD